MAFGGFILTRDGREQIASASSGGTALSFTHVAFGSGRYSGSYSTRTALVDEVMRVPVGEVICKDGTITISADWTNRDAPSAFYLREIGLIGNNKLCYYDNAGEDAEWIDPNDGNVTKQKRIRCVIDISGDAQVEPVIPTALYALESEVAERFDDTSDRIEAVEGEIATVESSLVASHAYDVGEYLIYDDALYIVTADIASGDSLVIDTNIEATNVGEEICDLKKSVSDGKALVAGAITDNGVTTAADATFQTMADNIGDILEANPGSISSSVNVGVGYTQDVSISAPITINTAGYHSTDTGTRTEGSKSLLLENKGDNVELLIPTSGTPATAGRIAKTPGTISSSVSVAQDSTNSYMMNISAPMTVGTAGQHSSSVGTRTAGTKQIGLVNNGDKVNAVTNDSSMTVCASVDKTAGKITSSVSTSAGTSSTVSISAPMTINTDGHHSSNVGTRTAGSKSLTLANNSNNVDLKDGSTVIGRVAKTAGKITSSVNTTAGTSSTVSVTAGMEINTAGHHSSSAGTRTTGSKSLTLANNGANVELKDGTTVIGKVAKSTGSVTSSASFNSGTAATVTIKSAMTFTAGHITSKGTEGTATAYLRRSGNDVYLSSSSSGGTNYGKYTFLSHVFAFFKEAQDYGGWPLSSGPTIGRSAAGAILVVIVTSTKYTSYTNGTKIAVGDIKDFVLLPLSGNNISGSSKTFTGVYNMYAIDATKQSNGQMTVWTHAVGSSSAAGSGYYGIGWELTF